MLKNQPNRYPKKTEEEFKINEFITVPEVRLVGDNVENNIYPTSKALALAEQLGLDLVMITEKAVPPVCRIIDYSKFLYDKKKKEKEIKANTVKTVVKEIRFGPNTDEHDVAFKLKHAIKFLQEGSKVKAYVHFRGRAIVFKERGELLLLQFAQQLEEYGKLELMPKLEGKRMFITLAPKSSKNTKHTE